MFNFSGDDTTSVEPLTHGNRNRRSESGDDTSISLFPFYVSLHYDYRFICGGAIISVHFALTAASCVVQDVSKLLVRSGSNQRGTGGSRHHVRRFMIHDNFTSFLTGSNDIAVLKVVEVFSLDSNRAIIEMFRAGEEIKLGSAVDIPSLGNKVDQLQLTVTAVFPCQKVNNHLPPSGTFCVGDAEANICSKDAGSPVTIGLRLAGIVSNQTNCGNSPGVVIDVSVHHHWIINAIRQM